MSGFNCLGKGYIILMLKICVSSVAHGSVCSNFVVDLAHVNPKSGEA